MENCSSHKGTRIIASTLVAGLFVSLFFTIPVTALGPFLTSGVDPDFHPCVNGMPAQPYLAGFMAPCEFLSHSSGEGPRATISSTT